MRRIALALVPLLVAGCGLTRGDSRLHNSMRFPSAGSIQSALDAGADPNDRNKSDHTPLHYACIYNGSMAVRLLLKAGADPNIPDDRGRTSLHMCILHPNLDSVVAMVEAGADTSALTGKGFDAIGLAIHQREWAIAKRLGQDGAQAWVGRTERELIRGLGVPDGERGDGEGGVVLVYDGYLAGSTTTRSMRIGMFATSRSRGDMTVSTETMFWIDSAGRVYEAQFRGL